MKYSDLAIRVLAAKECGILKTNAQFWGNYSEKSIFISKVSNDDRILRMSEKISHELGLSSVDTGIVCAYDEDFPFLNPMVKNKGERPFLLFYRGDLSLLRNLNKNVAVIGITNPDDDIEKREREIVGELVNNDQVIVSGLAKGCDTIAHKTCLEMSGKTIAILPSQVNKVIPAENKEIADEIVRKGGLLVSEYYKDSLSKFESTNRFVERDRLQAMFSKAIILIASYRKGEGDSGSRHAMEAGKKYGIDRFTMFNRKTDEGNSKFGLNLDLVNSSADSVKILMPSSIEFIKSIENPNLFKAGEIESEEQLKLI